MKQQKTPGIPNAVRTALSLIMIGLYFIGLIVMIFGDFKTGVYLWVVSTVGGAALLYYIRTMDRRKQDAEAISKGMPYGDPDDPSVPLEPVVPEDEAEAPGARKDT